MRATFSLRFMLLFTAVFCGISAALFYLARIPIVIEEWHTLFGKPPPPSGDPSRGTWLVFLVFTYIAPLLLASVLYGLTHLWSWYEKRSAESEDPDGTLSS